MEISLYSLVEDAGLKVKNPIASYGASEEIN
jgi:hypothetical protein